MKSIIVTGATSYIATALTQRLLKENYKVYAIVRPYSHNIEKVPRHKNVEIIELDMQEINQLSDYKFENVEALYHFAWEGVRGEKRNDVALQQKNYEYSIKCIDTALKMGIPYFVGVGSQAEYAITKDIITEDTALRPDTEYGKQKAAVYKYGMDACQTEETCFLWARIFSTYGIGEDNNTLIMQCIERMRGGAAIDLSPCQHLWDYTYIDDVAEALLMLVKSGVSCGAYNISSGQAKPLKEFVEAIKNLMSSKSELRFGAIPYGSNPPIEMNPDVSKLKDATGWEPLTSFEEGIRKIIEGVYE